MMITWHVSTNRHYKHTAEESIYIIIIILMIKKVPTYSLVMRIFLNF